MIRATCDHCGRDVTNATSYRLTIATTPTHTTRASIEPCAPAEVDTIADLCATCTRATISEIRRLVSRDPRASEETQQ